MGKYSHELKILCERYYEIERNMEWLEFKGEDNITAHYRKVGSEYFLSKEFEQVISSIPKEVLKIFPIDKGDLQNKARKTLEELSEEN